MLYSKSIIQSTHQALSQEEEIYANQDHVDWQETPVSIYTQGEELRVFDFDKGVDKAFLTPTEKLILKAFSTCLTRSEVAEKVGISIDSLYVHIHNLKKKTLSL